MVRPFLNWVAGRGQLQEVVDVEKGSCVVSGWWLCALELAPLSLGTFTNPGAESQVKDWASTHFYPRAWRRFPITAMRTKTNTFEMLMAGQLCLGKLLSF